MAVTVNSPSIVYFSGNPIWFECESDQLGVQDPLRMECLIQLTNKAGVIRAMRIYETVNESDKFLFNIGPAVNSMIRDWFDLPNFENDLFLCPIMPVKAELSFIEIYAGIEQEQENFTTYIVNGALRTEQLDEPNDWWTIMELYFDGGDTTKIPFLTNKPVVSRWLPGKPECLYYYNVLATGAEVKICYEVFDKWENSLEIIKTTYSVVAANRVFMINAGKVFQGRFDGAPDDGRYDIWLEVSDVQMSEKRTYYVDTKKYNHTRTLSFLNKKNGFDIITLLGVDVQGGNVEKTIIEKEYEKGQKISIASQTVTRKKVERSIKKNSGVLLKSERTWLIELMESKIVHEVISYDKDNLSAARLLPVTIQNKDLPVIDSGEFRGEVLIEWTY